MAIERSECSHAALTRTRTPMLIWKAGAAVWSLGLRSEVAVRPLAMAMPLATDARKLPITYAASSRTARGRRTMASTAASAVGLVIADKTASGINWADTGQSVGRGILSRA